MKSFLLRKIAKYYGFTYGTSLAGCPVLCRSGVLVHVLKGFRFTVTRLSCCHEGSGLFELISTLRQIRRETWQEEISI